MNAIERDTGRTTSGRRTGRRQPTARPMQTPPYSKTGAQITGRKDVMPEVLAVVTRSWEAEGMSNRAPHANTRIRAPITEVLRQQFCRRCGYRWLPRQVSSPVRCPACKSPYWHRPRKPNRQAQEAAGTTLGALAAMPVVQAGAQSFQAALEVMKTMKQAGKSWGEIAEAIASRFEVVLEKDQLKALIR